MAESRPRTPLQITLAAWRALFLREAVTRLAAGRGAWVWLLVEPIIHVVFVMTLLGFIYDRMIPGVAAPMFAMSGLIPFFLLRNTATKSAEAVNANGALFTYRQVLPVDTVLVRAFLEGLLMVVSSLLLLAGMWLLGNDVVPADPLGVGFALLCMWLAGSGLGLLISVANMLVPETSKAMSVAFRILYLTSGVMNPAIAVPQPYRELLFSVNPFLHGIEALRRSYFTHYHSADEASVGAIFAFALVSVFLGLAMHRKFERKLIAQ